MAEQRWQHGRQYAYITKGCRCADCREWLRVRNAAARKRRAERARAGLVVVPHGLQAYRDYACRCVVCRSASTAYNRERLGRTAARVWTEAEIDEALRVYRRVGLKAAVGLGITSPSTIRKWAKRRGVECFRPDPAHGSRGGPYRNGCRCDVCVEGARSESRRLKEQRVERFRRGEVHPEHGKASTYINYACRCEPCRAAHSVRMAANKARRAG